MTAHTIVIDGLCIRLDVTRRGPRSYVHLLDGLHGEIDRREGQERGVTVPMMTVEIETGEDGEVSP